MGGIERAPGRPPAASLRAAPLFFSPHQAAA